MQPQVYDLPVSSKKGLIGIGVPKIAAAKSRNTAQSCGFFVRAPVLAARMGSRKARRLNSLRCGPGTPTRSSCLPRLASGVAVVLTATWRASMPTSSFPSVHVELLRDLQDDCARTNQAMACLIELLGSCDPDHRLSARGLLALLEPVAAGLDVLCGDLATAAKCSSSIN
jgi:hypothetical protein